MFTHLKSAFVSVLLILFCSVAAQAGEDTESVLNSLTFQSGSITLKNGLATIDQTANFRFLDKADTEIFLTRLWGNPPGAADGSLGMIVPRDADPMDEDGWAVLVSYDPSGYVSDEEAGKIDYDALMADMKKAVAEENTQRIKAGHETLELLGWAKKPYYDAAEKKMYWAKRLRFGDSADETLNYEIRVLGRNSVLDLNVIASMSALPSIDKRVDTILSMVKFNKGNTYAEYDAKVDKAAAYGLAGLIAGGVLTKAGFFKGLIALLLASKKLFGVVLVGAAAAGWKGVKALFRRKTAA